MTKFLELEKQSNCMAEPSDTNPSHSKEVDDDMTEPTASLESTPHVPYEVRTEGPLTYFHYYFEEVGATVDHGIGTVQQSPAKFLPNRYLIGAGVLTATALSGLAVAEMSKPQVAAKPHSPEATVQQNSPKATDTTKRLNLIGTAVQPLQANQPLWSNQSSSALSKTAIAPPAIAPTTAQRDLKNASQKRSIVSQPNTLSAASQPLRFNSLPLPRTMGQISLAQKPASVATVSQIGAQQKPAKLQPSQPAAPQPSVTPQPSTSQPLSQATVPAESQVTPSHQMSGISTPETLAPQVSDASTRAQTSAPEPVQTVLPLSSLPTQPNSQGQKRLELSMPQQTGGSQDAANPVLSEENATKRNVEALNADSVLPQSMQDLLNRSRPLPTDKAVTIVPLTQKVAEDVLAMNKAGLATDKAGRFTILHFNLQDYQKAWLASNKITQPQASATAFPTYGFVDYQARMIAVLDQKQPLRTSLQVGMLPPDK